MTPHRQPILVNVPDVVVMLIGAISAVSVLIMLNVGVLSHTLSAITVAYPGGVIAFPTSSGLFISERWMRPFGGALGYVLHVFHHAGWFHLLGNMGMLLALGAPVARRLGSTPRGVAAFVILFFLTAIVGSLAHVALYALQGDPLNAPHLVGASTGVSGMLAAAMYVWRRPPHAPLPSLNSEEYLTAISPWVLLNVTPLVLLLVAPTIFGSMLGGIAWLSHLGGIAAGALFFPILERWTASGQRPTRPTGWR